MSRLVLLGLAFLPFQASAADIELAQQGRVVDVLGQPFSGTESLSVALWDVSSGGSNTPNRLYAETFTNVPISDGYYAVILGGNGGLDATDVRGDVWLEVTVGATVLSPRTKVTDVPGSADLSTFDGVRRECTAGGHEIYNGSTGAWSGCPTSWDCTTDPSHAGCVSSSDYVSCLDIHDAPGFAGDSGTYYIDGDGALNGLAPWAVHCDMEHQGGGWTKLGDFEGTTSNSLSASQALTIGFSQARLVLNNTAELIQINCYTNLTAAGVQTTSSDKLCTESVWRIRFDIQSPVSVGANYGFYRGSLSANNGGCSWANDSTVKVWGRHHGLTQCSAMGTGEDYVSSVPWGTNRMWMYVR